jgi:hypothetical protein
MTETGSETGSFLSVRWTIDPVLNGICTMVKHTVWDQALRGILGPTLWTDGLVRLAKQGL